MMSTTPHLSLPYIMPAQAQKHVTHNDALRALDALTHLSVLDDTRTTAPSSPSEGDRHIIAAGATGDWAGKTGQVAAYQDGAWAYYAPQTGWRAWLQSNGALLVWDGTAWQAASAQDTLSQLGINTTADATNKFAVKSDAILLSHDDVTPGSGDMQIKCNKAGAGDTASFLFQTNFSGRAEFGLTGDDDFHIKVSANGSSFTDALTIDKDTGWVGIQSHSPTQTLEVGGNLQLTGDRPFAQWCDESGSTNQKYWRMAAQYGNFDVFVYDDSGAVGDKIMRASRIGATVNLMQLCGDVLSMSNSSNRVGVNEIAPGAALDVNGGVIVGAPSGGDKGSGSINAQSVFDDNALLSCYVFDQAIDHTMDQAKWDARVPDHTTRAVHKEDNGAIMTVEPSRSIPRRHDPLRKFAARIGTRYDPLTLEGYARHWKEKRHLTSLPNETKFDVEQGMATGAWIQRLVETAEIQAVLIDQLHQRLKALES